MLEAVLLLTTLLCALVAGLVLTFAVVVMPGIKTLDDRGFIRAFQVIDGVIQGNQPVFMAVWVGSLAASVVSLGLGGLHLAGIERALVVVATLLYLLTVQVPTFTVNVPLNNALQAVDLSSVDDAAAAAARQAFEGPWVRWNAIRTVTATAASTLLLLALLRL